MTILMPALIFLKITDEASVFFAPNICGGELKRTDLAVNIDLNVNLIFLSASQPVYNPVYSFMKSNKGDSAIGKYKQESDAAQAWQDGLKKIGDRIKDAGKELWNAIKEEFKQLAQAAEDYFKKQGEKIKAGLKNIASKLDDIFAPVRRGGREGSAADTES